MATQPHDLINDELDIEWESILEVGCGDGVVLEEIRKVYPNKTIKGIDNESEYSGISYVGNINIAKEKGLDVSRGDGRNIDYPDKSFDIVFCQALLVMSKVEDFKNIISEMIRVAKKKVVMIEPHSEDASEDGEYYARERLIADYRFLKGKIKKIPPELWGGVDGEPWGRWGHIITINL